jgi:hypothetical protein
MIHAVQHIVLAGAAVALPLSAFAHGSEFILAKMSALADGGVQLEVTADYGDNPMITSEGEAREAASSALRVKINGTARRLTECGDFLIEKRAQLDPTAPLPRDPLNEGKPHQLITAVWRSTGSDGEVSFEVPPENTQPVLLWKVEPGTAAKEVRWMMLVAGETSPAVTITRAAARHYASAGWIGVPLLIAGGLFAWTLKRRTRMQSLVVPAGS